MFTTTRIKIKGNDVYINKPALFGKKTDEHFGVISLEQAVPTIRVFENNQLRKAFRLETLATNPNLRGQYFHISVRIQENGAVMIDGVISKYPDKHANLQDDDFEGIRFQPFFLNSIDPTIAQRLIGNGVFAKGLHYAGLVTPTSVRVICVCDKCNKSFTVQHVHAGFSECQYFYSDDSQQTLLVSYGKFDNMPQQLQEAVDDHIIAAIESQLPEPTTGKGSYRYYNSFCCPHCLSPYIDFQKNKHIRPSEYYALTYINHKFYSFKEH
ncbi:MAG TPA: hypothetical protein VKZ42_00050 [Flavobacteriaceae bacterium]|nr:hypothetical protein [Flavobacteriaceae bacterium]